MTFTQGTASAGNADRPHFGRELKVQTSDVISVRARAGDVLRLKKGPSTPLFPAQFSEMTEEDRREAQEMIRMLLTPEKTKYLAKLKELADVKEIPEDEAALIMDSLADPRTYYAGSLELEDYLRAIHRKNLDVRAIADRFLWEVYGDFLPNITPSSPENN